MSQHTYSITLSADNHDTNHENNHDDVAGTSVPGQDDQIISKVHDDSKEDTRAHITIVGTAHVSEKSVADVRNAILTEKPDIVAVELCKGRYDSLMAKQNGEVQPIKIAEMLKEGKLYFFLVHSLLAYVQNKIGADMGVEPGAEMIAAIDLAKEQGAQIALIDRDIQITLTRFWTKMKFMEKIRMVGALLGAVVGIGGQNIEIDMDSVTDEDVVTSMIEELKKYAPTAAEVLVNERDAYLAHGIRRAGEQGRVVAVVGAGHRKGIKHYLEHPETLPDMAQLIEIPKKSRISVMNVIGVGFVAIAIAVFALVIAMLLQGGISFGTFILIFGYWVVINGVLSALGVIIARGHIYSAITAFCVAWLTSLNPLMAAGWFAGLMEAKMNPPSTQDLKTLMDAETTSELTSNRLFKVIFVAAMANIGSIIGTFLGAWVMLRVSGIDVEVFKDMMFSAWHGLGL